MRHVLIGGSNPRVSWSKVVKTCCTVKRYASSAICSLVMEHKFGRLAAVEICVYKYMPHDCSAVKVFLFVIRT